MKGVICGIDIGQRHLAWCKIAYDTSSTQSAWGVSSIPKLTCCEWTTFDLGDTKETKGVVERVVQIVKQNAIISEPVPDVIVIEQQFGHSNPRMTVISHALQAAFLFALPKAEVVFQNASSKFYMFKYLGLTLPHDTKNMVDDQYAKTTKSAKYKLTKENSKFLCCDMLAKFDNASFMREIYDAAQKKDDLADALGLSVTHLLRHILKVKKRVSKKRKRVQDDEALNKIVSCTDDVAKDL